MFQAKHFNESDIEEFRDCFLLFARNKVVTNPDELTLIMRSLGFSPTIKEIDDYFAKNHKDGRIDFATFLDIMHLHSQKEKCQQEVMDAFKAHDKSRRGVVNGQDLYHILTQYGEKLDRQEVDKFFKESGINPRGQVSYEDVMRFMLTPIPDY